MNPLLFCDPATSSKACISPCSPFLTIITFQYCIRLKMFEWISLWRHSYQIQEYWDKRIYFIHVSTLTSLLITQCRNTERNLKSMTINWFNFQIMYSLMVSWKGMLDVSLDCSCFLSGAPHMHKSMFTRRAQNLGKFGHLSIREILAVTWPYICLSLCTTGKPMWNVKVST